MNKTCTSCKANKSISDFYVQRRWKDGYDYYCKKCRNDANAKVQETKKIKCSVEECQRNVYAKKMCKMHYARVLANGTTKTKTTTYNETKTYATESGYLISAKRQRDAHLRYNYKITIDQFELMAEDGCNICHDQPERTMHVDHDHKCCKGPVSCGKCVRGVLCTSCNAAVQKYEANNLRLTYPKFNKIEKYVKHYDKIIVPSNN